MNARTIGLAREVFENALGLPEVDREAFVVARCAGNEELGAFVLEMLSQHQDQAPGMLDQPLHLDSTSTGAGQRPPLHLQDYELLRVLGEGGMAVVYEGRQRTPSRMVAIKVLRAAAASTELLRRFQYEVEVLGQLRHPGIAHIYEAGVADVPMPGGTSAKQPYYVMELIRGEPLTAFARTHGLSVRQRLELLARVCDAVQYAHQRGVIHRDLKPANILVEAPAGPASASEGQVDAVGSSGAEDSTGASRAGRSRHDHDSRHDQEPRPKVLDFGVARVVGSDLAIATMNTEAGRLVGTLAYMSPEQVIGRVDQTDTRSDVYSLGVILYELLTGRLPHEVHGLPLHEAAQRIAEQEPARVGRLDPSLRGDIETIVARAMVKDRERRYQSAHDLAEDIRRHLRHDAIEARRDSALYVLRKGMRRHRGLVAAASVLVVGLAGLAGHEWRQATRFEALSRSEGEARRTAESARESAAEHARQAREGEATAHRVNQFLLGIIELANPGPGRGYELSLTDAIDTATERLEAGALSEHPLVEAEVRRTLAKTYSNLELMDAVVRHRRWLVDHVHDTKGAEHLEYLQAMVDLGHACVEAARQTEAQEVLREALGLAQRLHGEASLEVYRIMSMLGNSLYRENKPAEALPYAAAGAEGMARIAGEHRAGYALFNLAGVYRGLQRMDEAEATHARALASLVAADPTSVTAIRCRWYFARIFLHLRHRDLGHAERELRDTMELAKRVLGDEHPETLSTLAALADVLREQGESHAALALLEEALERCRKVRRWVLQNERGLTLDLARILVSVGRPEDAAATLRTGLERHERAFGRVHSSVLSMLDQLAIVERDRGQLAAAAALWQDGAARLSAVHGDQDPRVIAWREKAAQPSASTGDGARLAR